jgi:hypothetical protein
MTSGWLCGSLYQKIDVTEASWLHALVVDFLRTANSLYAIAFHASFYAIYEYAILPGRHCHPRTPRVLASSDAGEILAQAETRSVAIIVS